MCKRRTTIGFFALADHLPAEAAEALLNTFHRASSTGPTPRRLGQVRSPIPIRCVGFASSRTWRNLKPRSNTPGRNGRFSCIRRSARSSSAVFRARFVLPDRRAPAKLSLHFTALCTICGSRPTPRSAHDLLRSTGKRTASQASHSRRLRALSSRSVAITSFLGIARSCTSSRSVIRRISPRRDIMRSLVEKARQGRRNRKPVASVCAFGMDKCGRCLADRGLGRNMPPCRAWVVARGSARASAKAYGQYSRTSRARSTSGG